MLCMKVLACSWGKTCVAQYLHAASFISVGQDVALDIRQRRSPVQNSRLRRDICSLQVLGRIDVCWYECT